MEAGQMHTKVKIRQNGSAGGLWLLGFVGALVYFLQYHGGSFWLVVVAVFKAVFWPAYLTYDLLRFIHG